MPQLDATTQGLEGLFQREVQFCELCDRYGPGQEYHRDPFRRFSRFRGAG